MNVILAKLPSTLGSDRWEKSMGDPIQKEAIVCGTITAQSLVDQQAVDTNKVFLAKLREEGTELTHTED